MYKLFISLTFSMLITSACYSQLNITPKTAALAQSVVLNDFLSATGPSSGIHSVTNVVYTGGPQGYGTFSGTSNIGIAQGIVLSTGAVSNIDAPASQQNDVDHTVEGDVDLQALTTGIVKDVSVLEFDFVPKTDTLTIRLVFASEEYPEYVCNNFRDLCGVFLTGPKPSGGSYANENIAPVPGSTIPIGVNSINPGVPGSTSGGGTCTGPGQSLAYSNFYVDNSGTTVIFDGFTTVIEMVIPLVVCGDYHFKFAVADVQDGVYDSGIFLEAYNSSASFMHLSATSGSSTSILDTTFLCLNDTVILTMPQAASYSWIPGGNSQSISVTVPGNYGGAIFNPANGCAQIFFTHHVITDSSCVWSDIGALSQDQVHLFPNPFHDKLKIELPDGFYKYNLCNTSGNVILSGSFEGVMEINDIGRLPAGIYILTVYSSSGSRSFKVVHQAE